METSITIDQNTNTNTRTKNNLIVRPRSKVSFILYDHWLNSSNFKVGLHRFKPLISLYARIGRKVIDGYNETSNLLPIELF
jgi:hypothetical protein